MRTAGVSLFLEFLSVQDYSFFTFKIKILIKIETLTSLKRKNIMKEENTTYYIYLITNLINGKTYVGQRKCPINKTPKTDINYMGSGRLVKLAENKYGKESFSKTILSVCYNKYEINCLETAYIREYRRIKKAEYNIANGGEGGNMGDFVNKKISDKLKGKNHPNFGKHLSQETKSKISCNRKGKASFLGMHHSKETKEKLSIINQSNTNTLGKHWIVNNQRSSEWRRKHSEAMKGKNNSFAKKVLCMELNKVFETAKEASEQLKVNYSCICSCCRGKLNTSGGYHWKYC
jgi:group I intron endonuclease